MPLLNILDVHFLIFVYGTAVVTKTLREPLFDVIWFTWFTDRCIYPNYSNCKNNQSSSAHNY